MCRILTADDDPLQLDLRKMLLESAGHQVTAVLSTRQAMRQIARGESDLLIMDLRFPNRQGQPDARVGMDLIVQVRKSGCKIPIIVLSGWPEDIYGQPEEQMVSRIMVKPVSPADLLAAVS